MSLKTKSVEINEVLDLAALSVAAAAQNGGMIAADVEARRLLDANPEGLTRNALGPILHENCR